MMLRIAVASIAYIGLFTSPSALRIPDATRVKIKNINPPKTICPYCNARVSDSPAPIVRSISLRKIRINNVKTTESVIVSIIECMAALSEPFLFFAPIHHDINEFAPAPRPLPRPMTIMNRGVMNPNAARELGPSPATQILSARL